MDLLSYRSAVVAALAKALPERTHVAAHPGRFNMQELDRYSVKAPAVLVAVVSGNRADENAGITANVSGSAFIVTKRTRAGLADEAGLVLSSLVLAAFAGGLVQAGAAQNPTNVGFENLYNSAAGEDGIWLGSVAWRALVPIGLEAEAADAQDFLRLFVDYDLAPADARPEARDRVIFPHS